MLTFSNKRKYSGNICFSPDSNYFAISKGVQLVVYSIEILKPIKIYQFIDFIQDIKWSNNSKLILIGLYKRNRCEIRNIFDDNYICTIDEGIQGMSYALFSPDSLHVLSINEKVTKLSIRSLKNKFLLFINFPKFAKKGIAFSSGGAGNFMALAERKDTRDLIGIYYTLKWACIRRFFVQTEDLQDIKWSYDNLNILIVDTPALCRLLIYSILGELVHIIEVYQNKLGIKKFYISPNGHLLCLGLYDQTLRIYNSIGYTCQAIFDHNKDILYDNKVNYYKEEIINKEGDSKYIELKVPIDLKNENIYNKGKNLFNDTMPKIGVKEIDFSFENYFLATKNDNMPNVLFIWDLNLMKLQTVLIHLNEVIYFKWNKNNILFICTNNNKLYYYTIDSCIILKLNNDFHNKSITLSNDGKKMMVKDNNSFIMVNIDNEDNFNEVINNIEENNEEEQNYNYNGEEQQIEAEAEEQYEEEMVDGEGEGEEGEEYEGEQNENHGEYNNNSNNNENEQYEEQNQHIDDGNNYEYNNGEEMEINQN